MAKFNEVRETGARAIYKNYEGQVPETRSGKGSTLLNTVSLRASLSFLVQVLSIESVLDIPCGDLNWMSRVQLDRIRYTGADTAPELIATLRQLYPDRQFQLADARTDNLPSSDMILCRDLFIHLPNKDVEAVLTNLTRTKSKYLLTSHYLVPMGRRKGINAGISPGEFRAVNLTYEPFCLPPPILQIGEDETSFKSLGLWTMDTIRQFYGLATRRIA